MVRHVYVDLYLLVNFFMNAALLWGTARLAGLELGIWRMAAAALAGALYSVALLFPSLSFFFGPWAKLVFALLMLAIAFPRIGLAPLFKVCACFLVLSFSIAGMALGLLFLPLDQAADALLGAGPALAASPGRSSVSLLREPYPWWVLAAVTGTVIVMARSSLSYLRGQGYRRQNIYVVDVVLFGQRVRLKGFLDTGNELREPISGKPVVIAKYEALKDVLSGEVDDLMEALEGDLGAMSAGALAQAAKGRFATRFRIIPFRSLGNEKGIILGFRPDALVIHRQGKPFVVRDVVVGLWRGDLPPLGRQVGAGSCAALLSPYVFVDHMDLGGKAC